MEKQIITDRYAIYNDDCMRVIRELPDKSIDLSVYSPPFAGLYNYSSDERDFSNCESKEQFLDQYRFRQRIEVSFLHLENRFLLDL